MKAAADQIFFLKGGSAQEPSDRALLEVLLEGDADTCASSSACCEGDSEGDPDLCLYPPVCVEGEQRFDLPFRDGAARIVIHATDNLPAGCNDAYDPDIDLVFAERIADLAGEKGVHILAIADQEPALEVASLYAERSNGLIITPYQAPCTVAATAEDLAELIRGFDAGTSQRPCCPADIDGNGSVDGFDLGVLLNSWGDCLDCPADVNADDHVDGFDLGVFLNAWGNCP